MAAGHNSSLTNYVVEPKEEELSFNLCPKGKEKKGNTCNKRETRVASTLRSKIDETRRKVLKVTILMLVTYILCWTPYIVMTLWWQLYPSSAITVPKVTQNILFLFAVSNSCINPYLYGGFLNNRN